MKKGVRREFKPNGYVFNKKADPAIKKYLQCETIF